MDMCGCDQDEMIGKLELLWMMYDVRLVDENRTTDIDIIIVAHVSFGFSIRVRLGYGRGEFFSFLAFKWRSYVLLEQQLSRQRRL